MSFIQGHIRNKPVKYGPQNASCFFPDVGPDELPSRVASSNPGTTTAGPYLLVAALPVVTSGSSTVNVGFSIQILSNVDLANLYQLAHGGEPPFLVPHQTDTFTGAYNPMAGMHIVVPALPSSASFDHMVTASKAMTLQRTLLYGKAFALPATKADQQVTEQKFTHHRPKTDDHVSLMLAATKRLTGWTWEQLARCLGPSRQAIHAWTLGGDISADNFERLSRLHAAITFVDRGNVEDNRALLSRPTCDGRIAVDLLSTQQFDEFCQLLGRGQGRSDLSHWAEKNSRERQAEIARNGHWVDRLTVTATEVSDAQILKAPASGQRLTFRRKP